MCIIYLAQLGKQCCTLIKKFSIKINCCYQILQDRESNNKFPDMTQLEKQFFLRYLIQVKTRSIRLKPIPDALTS
jgi:hypothetical protein